MRFVLFFAGAMAVAGPASGQDLDLYEVSVQFGREIRRTDLERARIRAEFMSLAEKTADNDYDLVSRGPASLRDEDAAFINDFRVILIPKYLRYRAHN